MYKVIRIRVHGSLYDENVVARAIRENFERRIVLSLVNGVQMEGAVDMNCLIIGGWLRRTITVAKFIWKLVNLRSENINVEILWGV